MSYVISGKERVKKDSFKVNNTDLFFLHKFSLMYIFFIVDERHRQHKASIKETYILFKIVLVPSLWNFFSTIIVEPFSNCFSTIVMELFQYNHCRTFLKLFAVIIIKPFCVYIILVFSLGHFAILICSNKYIIIHILNFFPFLCF